MLWVRKPGASPFQHCIAEPIKPQVQRKRSFYQVTRGSTGLDYSGHNTCISFLFGGDGSEVREISLSDSDLSI